MTVNKTDQEWREQLTPQQYRVTRKHATEPAFTGEYVDNHADGTYTCVCCGAPLFDSATKYESHSGWPSFFAPIPDSPVDTETDRSWLMARTWAMSLRMAPSRPACAIASIPPRSTSLRWSKPARAASNIG